ncbi:MAG: hypothetical protein H0T73_12730 [Ardenticatenales bacterium]|nr:hypothetical protein [Ardenticatenales bacterium]
MNDNLLFPQAMAHLRALMAATLEQWALAPLAVLPQGEAALADALCAEYLIDNDTHDLLHRLWRWEAAMQAGRATLAEEFQAHALLEELLELFQSLRTAPTLGKRHDAIVPRWLAGESIAELAESRGTDEQRILVLLHEVVRYYQLSNLEALRAFLLTIQEYPNDKE